MRLHALAIGLVVNTWGHDKACPCCVQEKMTKEKEAVAERAVKAHELLEQEKVLEADLLRKRFSMRMRTLQAG
jgi:hypothetical protein